MYIEWSLDDIKNAHVISLRGSVRSMRIWSGNDASIWIVILRILLKIKNPGMIVYDLQFQ
jgi:hypothetical protein